jgi:hypothetical protein
METDIGNPIEYNPQVDDGEDDEPLEQRRHEEPMMHHYYMQPPPPPPPSIHGGGDKLDFTNLDKNTYIVMFVAFIVGFFMGKTMQPVILRAM